MRRRGLSLGSRRTAGGAMARARADGGPWRRAAAATVLLALLVGAVFAGRWLLTSPTFAVARVETGRYSFTAEADLEAMLRVRLGDNLWTCDTDSLERDIERLPWVREARVGRRLPASLTVRLWEWRPLLLVETDGRLAALLEDGALEPWPAHAKLEALPRWRGPAGIPSTEQRSGLLDLMTAIETAGLARVGVVTAVEADDQGLAVCLEGGPRLQLGRESFVTRLKRYLAVADQLGPVDDVDLRFRGQVFVKDGAAAGT